VATVGLGNLKSHWALATFSVAAALGIWFIIQDVENPRVEGLAPAIERQAIQVQFVNGSADYIPVEAAFVRVRVEAREEDLANLRAGDFTATVDLQGLEPGSPVRLPVTVQTSAAGVRVLSVEPDTVEVELEPVARKEVRVTVNVTAPVPDGFELVSDQTVIDPSFVTVTGREELVANVDRVQIDVNLSGKRESFSVTGDLVPRSVTGQTQLVSLSSTQARVTFTIEQRTSQRDFAVLPRLSGQPASGYHVTGISIEPSIARVTGPKDVLDGLTELSIEALDLGGATTDITREKAIQRPQNVVLSPEKVVVKVTIAPIVCGESGPSTACGGQTFLVAPTFTDVPDGLALSPGVYTAIIVVAGPLSALADLDATDVGALVSLAGGTAGTGTFPVTVTVPAGIQVVGSPQVVVTLVAATVP
jgi:YbbR domain-containing protein